MLEKTRNQRLLNGTFFFPLPGEGKKVAPVKLTGLNKIIDKIVHYRNQVS